MLWSTSSGKELILSMSGFVIDVSTITLESNEKKTENKKRIIFTVKTTHNGHRTRATHSVGQFVEHLMCNWEFKFTSAQLVKQPNDHSL